MRLSAGCLFVVVGSALAGLLAVPVARPQSSVIAVPRAQSPPSIDCSQGGWDGAKEIELSQTTGTVVRLYPSPAAELPTPPEEVRTKLSTYKATYQLEWDATNLYVKVQIRDRDIDIGHPSVPQEDALKTGGANLLLPDMLYDTAILQLLAPSLERYVTEMNRGPGPKSFRSRPDGSDSPPRMRTRADGFVFGYSIPIIEPHGIIGRCKIRIELPFKCKWLRQFHSTFFHPNCCLGKRSSGLASRMPQ